MFLCVEYYISHLQFYSRQMPLRRAAKSASFKTQKYFDFTQYTFSPVNPTDPLITYPASVQVLPNGTIVTHTNVCGADCTQCLYSRLQEIILKIIQYVTDHLTIEPVLTELLELRTEITSQQKAENALQRIENIILTVIDNITNRTNLTIILGRIDYLRNELARTEDTSTIYTEIFEIIVYIIDQIGSGQTLDPILETIQTLRSTLIPDVAVARHIQEIEKIILSIVDNITNRVNLNVVLSRFVLLQNRLSELLAITNTGL
jgi:hypothetical protein